MERIRWTAADIGDNNLADLQYGTADNTGKVFFRLATKTKDPMIYNYVDEAAQRGGIKIPYDEADSQNMKFAGEIMENIASYIEQTLKHMKTSPERTAHINPDLKNDIKSILKIYPVDSVITGEQNQMIVTCCAVLDR